MKEKGTCINSQTHYYSFFFLHQFMDICGRENEACAQATGIYKTELYAQVYKPEENKVCASFCLCVH